MIVEKGGLDNKYTLFKDNIHDSSERRKIKEKVIKFVENAPNCKNFSLKDGEIKSKIYWCKLINKSCTYNNCPLLIISIKRIS